MTTHQESRHDLNRFFCLRKGNHLITYPTVNGFCTTVCTFRLPVVRPLREEGCFPTRSSGAHIMRTMAPWRSSNGSGHYRHENLQERFAKWSIGCATTTSKFDAQFLPLRFSIGFFSNDKIAILGTSRISDGHHYSEAQKCVQWRQESQT